MTGDTRLTVGVEEEYLLIEPRTRAVHPGADMVIAKAALELGDRIGTEITRFQLEARSDPHHTMAELAEQVRSMRRTVALAAAHHDLRVISSGTPVLGAMVPPPITTGARYAASVETFRALDDEQSVCACHVHVGIDDRALALQVSNHLRPWLSVLVAIGANSPFWAGRDTGYASWRTITWARWPVAGPPPLFHSPHHFDDIVGQLCDTGAIIDRRGLYWDVRVSTHVPTLEVRVSDAATTTTETVFLAAVIRALVDTALADIAAGEPCPTPDPELLRVAHWRAARDGLNGYAVDIRAGTLLPATTVADHLLAHIGPALRRNRDLDLARAAWRWIRAHGVGADRQHQAHHRRHQLADVVDALTLATSDNQTQSPQTPTS